MKLTINPLPVFLCLLLLVFSAAAQTGGWTRIESVNKEISFAVPKDYFYFFDKEGFSASNPQNYRESADFKNLRALTAYENDATMFFESYDVKNSKKVVSYLLSGSINEPVKQVSFEKFSGFQIVSDNKTGYSIFFYLASDTNVYFIGFGARQKDNETLAKFLNSLRLNEKAPFDLPAGKFAEADKTLSVADLPETPTEVSELTKEEKKQLKIKQDEAQKNPPEPPKPTTGDREPLIILFKPRASYTDAARQIREQGTVIMRATFEPTGRISKITIIKGLKEGLTEQAIKALKRIRFIPATKDKRPIESTKAVEYSFTLY